VEATRGKRETVTVDQHVISLSALTAKAICQQQQQPKLLSHQENKNASALND